MIVADFTAIRTSRNLTAAVSFYGQMTRHEHRHEHKIESWMDLARLIDKLSRQDTTWLFRGEPATTYELRPAAGREGKDERSARTLKYDLEQERIALRRFRHDAQPFVGFRPHSDLVCR